MRRVYCRRLEDNSGFGVFLCAAKGNQAGPGRDRWEECLGVGSTLNEAWADYQNHK